MGVFVMSTARLQALHWDNKGLLLLRGILFSGSSLQVWGRVGVPLRDDSRYSSEISGVAPSLPLSSFASLTKLLAMGRP